MGDLISGTDFSLWKNMYSNSWYTIKHTRQGKQRYLALIQSIIVEAKEEYLNLKRTNTSQYRGSISGEIIDSSNVPNDTNLLQRLYYDILSVFVNTLTPPAKDQIISHLQSLEVKERYCEGCTPEDKVLCEVSNVSCQKPPTTQVVFVSSTGKKYKNGFQDICVDFFPHSKFPEGLLLAQSIFCAKAALEFYNDKRDKNYKLVEPLASGRYLESDIRFHCNFTASKLKKNGSRTQPKLFFGTFLLRKKIRDMHCHIIDPAKAYFMCCEYCPPDLAHSSRFRCSYEVVRLYFGRVKEFNARKNRFFAEIALDVFNKKHGTEYKLVKPLESHIVPVSYGVYKFHCNFKAKLENPDSTDDGSPKRFFGDIVKSTLCTEGDCCILENTEGLDDHCSICRQGILHPAHYRIAAIPRD